MWCSQMNKKAFTYLKLVSMKIGVHVEGSRLATRAIIHIAVHTVVFLLAYSIYSSVLEGVLAFSQIAMHLLVKIVSLWLPLGILLS